MMLPLFLSEIIIVCSCVMLAVVGCIPSLQVVIMDVEIKQTVGVVNIERNASPFLYLMPCRQRDLLYCLHENGCVSVRVQQPLQLPTAIPMSPFDTKVLYGWGETFIPVIAMYLNKTQDLISARKFTF